MGVDDIIFNDYEKDDFESLCAGILRQALLWRIERTGKTRDGGKDLVMTTDKGKTVYVECKALSDRVQPKEIRAFHSVCVTDRVGGVFISVSGFTPQALEEARTKRIRTYDASDLIAMIRSYDRYKQPFLFSFKPITMDNARRNKVGVLMVANTLRRNSVPKVVVTIDGVEAPPIRAGDILYVALPNGRHAVNARVLKHSEDFDIMLDGEASIVLSVRFGGYTFVQTS